MHNTIEIGLTKGKSMTKDSRIDVIVQGFDSSLEIVVRAIAKHVAEDCAMVCEKKAEQYKARAAAIPPVIRPDIGFYAAMACKLSADEIRNSYK